MIAIDTFVTGDRPDSWASAGFALDGSDVHIGHVRIRCAGDQLGNARWLLAGLDEAPASLDGIATEVVEPGDRVPGNHPNGVASLDHVVLNSPDLARTTAAFEALGIMARRTRDAEIRGQAIRQVFFRAGEVIVELTGTREPTGDGPASIWGFAFNCPDLDASVASFGEACSPARTAVQPGRRIAVVDNRALGISATIALMTPHVR